MSRKDDEAREKQILLDKRIIYLKGEIDLCAVEEIGKQIVFLNVQNNQEITLYIDSSGGSVDAGLTLYSIIKQSNAPVTGIAYCWTASMAFVVLQACVKRRAIKYGRVLIHSVSYSNSKRFSVDELKKLLEQKKIEKIIDDLEKDQIEIDNIFAQRSGLPLSKIKELRLKGDEDHGMRVEEAKQFNLIDEIIELIQ